MRGVALSLAFVLLIAIGIGASVLRLVFPTDVITRFEPVRTAVHQAVGLTEPDPLRRAEAVADLDRKFATHWLATRLHVVSGACSCCSSPSSSLVPCARVTAACIGGRGESRSLRRG